jgi:hypothetical protein
MPRAALVGQSRKKFESYGIAAATPFLKTDRLLKSAAAGERQWDMG